MIKDKKAIQSIAPHFDKRARKYDASAGWVVDNLILKK